MEKKAIETGDAKMVGEMMYENHDLLNSIGVSHEKLDKLIDIAKDAGALGAKLTGGGGGGNMVALAETKSEQKKIYKAITEAGYRAYQTSFGEVMNLKEFVDLLEANGKLKRVTKEVDPVYEVAALMEDAGDTPLYLENVKGSVTLYYKYMLGN